MTHLNLVRGDRKSKTRECQRKEETHFQEDFILLRIDITMIDNRRLRFEKGVHSV